MAYNLQSLITILQQILNPQQSRWIFDHSKPQLESLLQKAETLQQILEKSSLTKIGSLEGRIRDAAYKAEDVIESEMVHQMLSNPEGVSLTFSSPDLQQVTQELDIAMEQVVKTMSTGISSSSGASFSHDLTPNVQQAMPTDSSSSSKKDLVGVDADLMQLKDRLTYMRNKLEIIPIVGMGGIGKSTLARNLYSDPDIVSHFQYRGWAAISQVYNMRDVLLSLLRNPNGKLSDELIDRNEDELKDILYKRLFGRRYIIVLDDIWSTKFWDETRMYFPDKINNGSRIVITTRVLDVAANWKSVQHHMQLLNKSASWDLLRQIVFGEEDCPRVLQGIGTKIASDCDGLPLAIHVIGGLLSKVERSRDVWEHISTDVKAALVESDEEFSNILSLSYNHLPNQLKPCFLYMGAFPEDFEVKGSRLVNIWIAEGFVKSNGDRSLEEVAQNYLKALVERNLLLVTRKKSNGKPMSYSIHDLLRDLCIRKADEEKFLNVENSKRRVSVHSSYEMEEVCASPQLMSLARSFICTDDKILSPICSMFRLVRVLDVIEMVFEEFPQEILQLVNLRYLAFSANSGLPIGISRFWNLHTLICLGEMDSLPSEIWELGELRYLKVDTFIEIEEGYEIKFVHKKLQTLYYVTITPTLIRNGFFDTIPNIVRLGIHYDDSPDIEVDLRHLHKLETLRCSSDLDEDGSCFLPNLRFPCNLRKLNVDSCVIFGSFLTTVCGLQNLEVFSIIECVFERDGEAEEEWETREGDEFRSLQQLCLQSLNLVRWRADETNFPRLRELAIINCYELEGIPCAIGDIPTLQLIEIEECGASVVASALEIQKVQQEEYDNYDLQVDIY